MFGFLRRRRQERHNAQRQRVLLYLAEFGPAPAGDVSLAANLSLMQAFRHLDDLQQEGRVESRWGSPVYDQGPRRRLYDISQRANVALEQP